MLVGKIFGRFFTFNISYFQLSFSLSLLLLSVWDAACLGFLDASVASRSVSRHTLERGCCLGWQLIRRPGGMIGCQTPAHEKKPTRWGKRQACQWKLNHLSSSTLSPTPTRVQQGKLYRPKGRLTSLEPWNRSHQLPDFGARAAVTHCAQRGKIRCWNYEHRFWSFMLAAERFPPPFFPPPVPFLSAAHTGCNEGTRRTSM